jgi:hypothetical protein
VETLDLEVAPRNVNYFYDMSNLPQDLKDMIVGLLLGDCSAQKQCANVWPLRSTGPQNSPMVLAIYLMPYTYTIFSQPIGSLIVGLQAAVTAWTAHRYGAPVLRKGRHVIEPSRTELRDGCVVVRMDLRSICMAIGHAWNHNPHTHVPCVGDLRSPRMTGDPVLRKGHHSYAPYVWTFGQDVGTAVGYVPSYGASATWSPCEAHGSVDPVLRKGHPAVPTAPPDIASHLACAAAVTKLSLRGGSLRNLRMERSMLTEVAQACQPHGRTSLRLTPRALAY